MAKHSAYSTCEWLSLPVTPLQKRDSSLLEGTTEIGVTKSEAAMACYLGKSYERLFTTGLHGVRTFFLFLF